MAFLDEQIAAAIAVDAERVRMACTAVPLAGDAETGRDDLLEAYDLVVANAADAPNGFGPAALDLCRHVGREADAVSQSAAFFTGLQATVSDDATVAALAGSALLYGLALSIANRDYKARQDAEEVRSDFLAAADAIQNAASTLFPFEAFDWVMSFVGEVSTWLAETAANRVPVVQVDTALSMPAPLLAYKLYGDPGRAAEVVERNRTGTPLFLPVRLEALAQ